MDRSGIFRNADISACNADEPVDLKNVSVGREKPLNERADDYIRQVRNPYLFRVGSTVVKVEFGNGGDFVSLLSEAILTG